MLNSNKIKTEAFYKTALPYGEDLAKSLVDYHVANGGVSRYQKFSYFLDEIFPKDKNGPQLKDLLDIYAKTAYEGLISCEIDESIFELRKYSSQIPWFIVSGGDQDELKKVFTARSLDHLFDGGIYGSPDSKEKIFQREISAKRMAKPGLFIGDSRYDYEASKFAGLDFIFVEHWTEFINWHSYCKENEILVINNLNDLIN